MGWVLNISNFLPCPGFCCGQLYLIRSSCHTLHTHLHFKYIPLFLSILLFIPRQHLHNFLPSLGSLGPTITVWLAAGPLTDLDLAGLQYSYQVNPELRSFSPHAASRQL